MKTNILPIILLALCCATLRLSAQPQTYAVSYYKGNFQSAIDKAQEQGKLLYLEFQADWCVTSGLLTEMTYKDSELVTFLNQRTIPLQIDNTHPEYYSLSQRFNVTAYPTIVILNNRGTELERLIDKAPRGSELHQTLTDYSTIENTEILRTPAPEPSIVVTSTTIAPATTPIEIITEKREIHPQAPPQKTKTTTPAPQKKVVTTTTTKKTTTTTKPAPAPPKKIVAVAPAPSTYHTLRVGTYSTKDNALARVKELNICGQSSWVEEVWIDGKKNYRVNFGLFKTREEAATFQQATANNEIIGKTYIVATNK